MERLYRARRPATDARHTRPFGIPSYAAIPSHIDKELLETVHAENERIPVRVLQEGMRYLAEFLMEVVT